MDRNDAGLIVSKKMEQLEGEVIALLDSHFSDNLLRNAFVSVLINEAIEKRKSPLDWRIRWEYTRVLEYIERRNMGDDLLGLWLGKVKLLAVKLGVR